MDTIHEYEYNYCSYLSQLFVECEIFQIKFVDKIKTHILCSINLFLNCAFYEVMWKNIVKPGRPQMTEQYGSCALHAG